MSDNPFPENTKTFLSKSKVGTYKTCPYSYKLGYIDRKPKEVPFYFTIGLKIHNSIETYFKELSIINGQIKTPRKIILDSLGEKIGYHKNFLKFELDRWNECRNKYPENPEEYYMPILNETHLISYDLQLIGIIDRLHKAFSGEYVVVENKTGKPTKQKVDGYEEDLYWYKILVENIYKYNVNYGSIYFPYDNSTYNFELTKEKTDKLLKEIEGIREKINKEEFEPTPEKNKCANCLVRQHCEYREDINHV